LRAMDPAIITIGSHMRTEAYLPDTLLANLPEEIMGSKRILEAELHGAEAYLSYPIGGFSENAKRMVREAGYTIAFTTNRGFDRFAKDPYELKRIRIKNTDHAFILWAKLSGYYNFFRSSKKPY
ncbi:MAG: polysaccharide deacetylase family protein, partial [Candidatus Omnitrophica bacterium]|nr:polysaccharide deacetylase family protein [Candidatus Omnitrophota bacterium]